MKSALAYQWYLKRKNMAILWFIDMVLSLVVAVAGGDGLMGNAMVLFFLNAQHVILGLSFFFMQGDKLKVELVRSLPVSHREDVYQGSMARMAIYLFSFLVVYLLQWVLTSFLGGALYSWQPVVLILAYGIFLDQAGAISIALSKDGRTPILLTTGLYVLTLPIGNWLMKHGMGGYDLFWPWFLAGGLLIFILGNEATAKIYERHWEH